MRDPIKFEWNESGVSFLIACVKAKRQHHAERTAGNRRVENRAAHLDTIAVCDAWIESLENAIIEREDEGRCAVRSNISGARCIKRAGHLVAHQWRPSTGERAPGRRLRELEDLETDIETVCEYCGAPLTPAGNCEDDCALSRAAELEGDEGDS